MIIPLIYLTEALPISINGLGVRESAFAFFFVMNGLTVEEGIAVSLLIVAERYLLGILGGSLLLASVHLVAGQGGRRRLGRQRAGARTLRPRRRKAHLARPRRHG